MLYRYYYHYYPTTHHPPPHYALYQVTRSAQLCPGMATDLTKEFNPHMWTEFTESIDVVGARKNRIESAQNISDVLEVAGDDKAGPILNFFCVRSC